MQTYKVLIVDDEETVRSGLRSLIPWQEEGFSVCGEGRDGKDGLQKLMELEPQLALVDIKMPGMTGIELIREAREHGYTGEFIILTGYSEFTFAQSAISLGVKEYLLKPVDEDELLEIVRKLRRQWLQKADIDSFHRVNEQKARQELLRRILLHLESRETLEYDMQRYHFSFGSDICCAAIVRDEQMTVGTEDSRLYDKLQDLVAQSGYPAECAMMDGRMVLVSEGLDYKKWAESLAAANCRIERKYGRGFLVAVGYNAVSWNDLCYSYEFAKYLTDNDFLFQTSQVLSIDTIRQPETDGKELSTDYLMVLIEVGDLEGIQNTVEQYHAHCIQFMMREPEIKMQVIYQLMQLKSRLDEKYAGENGVHMDITARMEQLLQTRQLKTMLNLYCRILQDMSRQIGNISGRSIINRVYYYIEKNYAQDLKLENIAKLFGYNSAYLGKVFHKEIGESFNNVLDTIRISNAKRLLAETDLKVYRIAEMVGIENIDYFYMKFKKYAGMSPKVYRKQLESGQGTEENI